ncbi:TPA: phage tail protein [Streptococcus suis]|uniref:adenylosuccinate synthetase n=1 Tax=Streptococcus suis TaxID=1307 RepID=UPI0003F5CE89|nr:adenylosuccinate synthetase [Streptococcus suis]MBO4130944.1 phage tail protein [Streptococcus suis]MBO4133700.1 phage tail protein [Streptococcus suis]NQK13263.1 phage tail protein [Streptococcus suis]NQK17038.1 phage tail protein [Streptococcus suis]NQM24331.1 phage tail protein [Streptococcus suis]
MNYLIINDLNTLTLADCHVLDFGKAQASIERSEQVDVFGANGQLHVSEGAYDGYNRTFTITLRHLADAMRLIETFRPDNNIVEFGYLRDSLFYCDLVSSSYAPLGPHRWKVEITVSMHPFRYVKNPADVALTSSGSVQNPGTVYSEPIIIIEGSGRVTLTIGQQVMELELDTRATIDCRHKRQNIYDKNGAVKNTIRKRGPFFEIPVGRSGISTSGTVTKITIKGNWRYTV